LTITALTGTVAGTVAVPDAYGRCLATVGIGNQTFDLALYVTNTANGFAIDVDAGTLPVLGGLIGAQANAGLYDNSRLNAPVVFSTWGRLSGFPPTSVTAVGLASGFDAGAGTFNLTLDSMVSGTPDLNQALSGTYHVAGNGRTTLSYSVGPSVYYYVLYLDDVNDGYMQGSGYSADFGFFEAQAAGPFANSSINGTFAAGTWFPAVSGTADAVAQITLTNGTITGTSAAGALSGSYAVSPSGRGTGTLNPPIFGTAGFVFYVIGGGSIELMGTGAGTMRDSIAFLHR